MVWMLCVSCSNSSHLTLRMLLSFHLDTHFTSQARKRVSEMRSCVMSHVVRGKRLQQEESRELSAGV